MQQVIGSCLREPEVDLSRWDLEGLHTSTGAKGFWSRRAKRVQNVQVLTFRPCTLDAYGAKAAAQLCRHKGAMHNPSIIYVHNRQYIVVKSFPLSSRDIMLCYAAWKGGVLVPHPTKREPQTVL
jgi:hypothetical protein